MTTHIDRARLLIRVANVLGENFEGERRSLLQWADELLGGVPSLGSSVNGQPSGDSSGISFPLPIFRLYKDRRFDGQLLENGHVQMNGITYTSVTGAAFAVSGHSENGWVVWKFKHPDTGVINSIGTLRPSGGMKRR